jgi:hypothetical protein
MNIRYKNNVLIRPAITNYDKFKFIRIIQAGAERTGSTLLTNLLYGFFLQDERIHWINEGITDYLILKTHCLDLDRYSSLFDQYKLYYCISCRDNCEEIDEKYKNNINVLRIDYNDILETTENTLNNIIDEIYNKFVNFFPVEAIPITTELVIKQSMLHRITEMNNIYSIIKDMPFEYCNEFYGIRGHHRNRIK